MNPFFSLLLFFAAFIPLKASCDELFLEVGGATGRFIGLHEDYLDAELFYVMDNGSEWAQLFDAHAYLLEEDSWAGSLGLGLRYQGCECDRLYGVNLFYDFREFEFHEKSRNLYKSRHKSFQRGGIGFESLGSCIDYRLNVYLPIGNDKLNGDRCIFDHYVGDYSASNNFKEYLPKGFDAEVGFKSYFCDDWMLYGALGGYYFDQKHLESYGGPMARFDVNWRSWLSLEGRYSYDHVNHSAFQGRIFVTIPLIDLWNCCSEACECFNLFIQPLQRNGLIFTDSQCFWKYNW